LDAVSLEPMHIRRLARGIRVQAHVFQEPNTVADLAEATLRLLDIASARRPDKRDCKML
jgi:hypothetical protein